MLGVGLSIPAVAVRGRRGPVFEPETTALLSRMTVTPDATRQGHINTLIKSLKTAGVWNKLDCLYVMAAHDAQAGRLNWKQALYNLVPINSPTFTVDRGYASDGSTSYFDTGAPPSSLLQFKQNDAHIGGYAVTASGGIGGTIWGRTTAGAPVLLNAWSTSITGRVNNSSSGPGFTVPSQIGHSVLVRTTATSIEYYKNSTFLGAEAATSSPLDSTALSVLRGGSGYDADTVGCAHIGAALGPTELSAYRAALLTYMQAVGAA